MKSFDALLEESVSRHGHLCAGQVIGVRMAMLGCRLVGIEDPNFPEYRKKLITFVEIDRCATDAIESVTGCRMGKRTLKFKDFGINAATFVNLDTREAYRIVSTEHSRGLAADYAPHETSVKRQQLEGYKRMPDHLLFDVQRVRVDLPECEMPGPPRRHTVCENCGQVVRDGKEIQRDGRVLCRPCGDECYFFPREESVDHDPSGPLSGRH
ncbi:MAG: FmdE family protein [Desulfobacteraceae bacterium]|jgi:formylmethanofuran dehydrogenase subunit E